MAEVEAEAGLEAGLEVVLYPWEVAVSNMSQEVAAAARRHVIPGIKFK